MGAEPNTPSLREEYEAQIIAAGTSEEFEQTMNSMLKKLGTSHTGFFHEGRPRTAGRIAIAATLTKAETSEGIRWMFPGRGPRRGRGAGRHSIRRRAPQGWGKGVAASRGNAVCVGVVVAAGDGQVAVAG
jgi:hypothetical protein